MPFQEAGIWDRTHNINQSKRILNRHGLLCSNHDVVCPQGRLAEGLEGHHIRAVGEEAYSEFIIGKRFEYDA